MLRTAALLALLASPAVAAGYENHSAIKTLKTQPCTYVVALIDMTKDGKPSDLPSIIAGGMYWGFLLGFDNANGGLQGSEETTLIRLRKACAASPETPALELLQGFSR